MVRHLRSKGVLSCQHLLSENGRVSDLVNELAPGSIFTVSCVRKLVTKHRLVLGMTATARLGGKSQLIDTVGEAAVLTVAAGLRAPVRLAQGRFIGVFLTLLPQQFLPLVVSQGARIL